MMLILMLLQLRGVLYKLLRIQFTQAAISIRNVFLVKHLNFISNLYVLQQATRPVGMGASPPWPDPRDLALARYLVTGLIGGEVS